ncbi:MULTISPECIES: TadA family conjugal transfer-associated ATPase [Cryobacterium]|uniref:TadA family conjugal transfer-associated ATPase n=1 Tax=Cryobacterium breve TaxID=1259258 RepID=A0ABY2J7F3_9MICO|nr:MULTISPECIES: TadA family conjugal transfer-associated ATPase [Cryobacterium]TFC94544.1 TadA family conjugal transfer-associated ATPase [Cryobacterium sp. TmT3-12]TFD00868.1 TadA family conjugal transfer-associated ATPase [Cryobacterium breve]
MPEPFVAVPSYGGRTAGARRLGLATAAVSLPSTDAAPLVATAARPLDVSGLGPLAEFARNEEVTDLFVNGDAGLWVDTGHGLLRQPDWNFPEPTVRELAVRLIALGGRHIDEASPCVDVRLSDGIRVHAVLPPASSTGTLLSIRLPRAERLSLAALAADGLFGMGAASVVAVDRLRAAVRRRENLLITGAAGSGKTTLLAALLGEAMPGERIVAIEDVAELRVDHPHVVALEARQPNLEGAGRIGLDALLREALRMRPDRLVLGECRGAEIRELLAALNTGHDGGAGTLHANSLRDVPARLEALGALAGLGPEAVARQAVSAIGLVLHLERRDGRRCLAPIGRFALDDRDRLVVVPAHPADSVRVVHVGRPEQPGKTGRTHGRRAAAPSEPGRLDFGGPA